MSTAKKGRKSLFLGLFTAFWLVAALGAVYYVKPDFWKDGYSYYTAARELADKGKYDQALAELETAVEREPKNAGYLVFRASVAGQAGKDDQAAADYAKALTLEPGNVEAALGLGKLLLARGQENKALDVLAKLDAAALMDDLLLRRAEIEAQFGAQKQAVRDFVELLRRKPGDAGLLRRKAASEMALKDYAEAEADLKALAAGASGETATWARGQLLIALREQKKLEEAYGLLTKAPTPENLRERAELALELSRFEDAVTLFSEAARKNPDDADIKNKLATALRASGSLAEAYQAMRRAPNPENLPARAQMAMQLGRFDEAIPLYGEILKTKPGDAAAENELATALRASGRLEEAYAAFSKAPTAENLPIRAQMALQLKKFSEAAALYKELLAKNPDDAEAKRQLALALRASGSLAEAYAAMRQAPTKENLPARAQMAMQLERFDEAIPAWREILAADPQNAAAKNELATALRAENQLEEAYKLFNEAQSPENLQARAQLAMRLQRFADAAALYREILAAAPGDAAATNQLALALRSLDRLEEAYGLFSQAPTPENLQARAELALQLRRYPEAADLFGQLAAKRPDDPTVTEKLAYALDKSQGGEKTQELAEKEYKALVDSGKADAETKARYAWLLMRQKRYAEAYGLLADLPTTDPALLRLRADAAFLAGRHEDAVKLLRPLAEAAPGDGALWKNLADALDALKRPTEAAEALARYAALAPKDLEAKAKLAGLYGRAGDATRAETLYGEVLAADPESAEAKAGLAVLYESAGNYDKALALLKTLPQARDRSDPGLVLRIANLYRFKKDYPSAAAWYRDVLALRTSGAVRRNASIGLAESLLEGGDPAGAGELLAKMGAGRSKDPALLLLAARCAMQTKRPAEAAAALERLAAARPLKTGETLWLAGQRRLAGDAAGALAAYEDLARKKLLTDPEALEALGDLRLDAGDPAGALAAYQAVPQTERTAGLALKTARAADKAGDKALALRQYEIFLTTRPDDPALLLELARFLINAGRHDQALGLYDQAVSKRGPKGLKRELALANLAAKRFPEAEKWARQALAEDQNDWKAVLALAQALHLQGKSAAADALLRKNRSLVLSHPEGKEWLGYVAVARDRQLEAFLLFDDLIKAGRGDLGNYWLWRGIAATRRGDYARAQESFDKAREYGKTNPDAPVIQ